jgi:predicted RNA-binding Zn-ribbon protein involved in translation (DUF1610 family)
MDLKGLDKITCKKCSAVLSINESHYGQDVLCPKCNAEIYIPLPEIIQEEAAASATKNVLNKQCPMCGETILMAAKKCKHCGEILDSDLKKTIQKDKNPHAALKKESHPVLKVVSCLFLIIGLPMFLLGLYGLCCGVTGSSAISLNFFSFGLFLFLLSIIISVKTQDKFTVLCPCDYHGEGKKIGGPKNATAILLFFLFWPGFLVYMLYAGKPKFYCPKCSREAI